MVLQLTMALSQPFIVIPLEELGAVKGFWLIIFPVIKGAATAFAMIP
ncbi:MAG: hypothetical protein BWY67_02334 [Bacteroidetes bacterium ADurb.Bin397]|nr:MAG: hypothetical protein BWY67_02334 [Bacteroidetes bacterium ADurb.Bin397]